MALIDDFKTKFPEFTSGDVDTRFPSLEQDWPCFYGCKYGANDCTDQAILYLIAHLYTYNDVSNGANPTKSVASKSVGSVSVSYSEYADKGANASFYDSTRYGKMFRMLNKKNRQGGVFV